MANILPFRALRYNLQRVTASQVVTQPYDKITPAMQEQYYGASPYNLVRIILGHREPDDIRRTMCIPVLPPIAANGALKESSGRTLLLQFTPAPRRLRPSGASVERRGFIALGRVEDYSAKVVYRHEQTLAKPKADRLDLLRATRTHFEQLFFCTRTPGRSIPCSRPTPNTAPTIEVADEYGVIHRVWQISDAGMIASVQEKMRDKKLVIADGHHRYETALNFRNECRAASGADPTSSPLRVRHDDFRQHEQSRDLLVLPTHRVVHSLDSFFADDFRDASRAYFDVDEVDPALDAARATALLRERGRAGTALLAVTANRAFVLHSPKPGSAKSSPATPPASSRSTSYNCTSVCWKEC